MKNKWASTGALCLAVFCQTYLALSAFTYSGFMAIFLIPGLTPETAGSRAGLISSSYMIGRTLSAYSWGVIADTIGRKPVFYASFIVPAIFSIWFGMAQSLSSALFARFMMGVANGLMMVAKTTVSELAKGDDDLEAKGMGLVMGMWGWGYLICPAISGVLSDPLKQYPDLAIVQLFEPFLAKYPFLLPNLVSVLLCAAGTAAVYFFVEETLPKENLRSISSVLKEYQNELERKILSLRQGTMGGSNEELLSLKKSAQEKENYVDVEKSVDTSAGDFCQESKAGVEAIKPSMSSLWARGGTRDHLVCFWLLSYASIIVDEGFPLFCMAKYGGLNVEEIDIGKLLSGAGLLFVLGQYSSYSYVMSRFGLYASQIIGMLLGTPITILMPFALYLDRGRSEENRLTTSAYLFICIIYGIKNIANNISTSSISIATNRSVPANQRATVNGLSQVGVSAVRAIGPICAGFLVSFLLGGSVFAPSTGVIILFCIISFLGLGPALYFQLFMSKYYNKDGSLKGELSN